MKKFDCICILLSESSNPLKGNLSIVNFFLKGLVFKIFNYYKNKRGKFEKVLIKNFINPFLPEKIIFYLNFNGLAFNEVKRRIENDMKLLKIEKFFLIK